MSESSTKRSKSSSSGSERKRKSSSQKSSSKKASGSSRSATASFLGHKPTVNESLAMRGMIENVKGFDQLLDNTTAIVSSTDDNNSSACLTLITQGNSSFNRKDQKAILRSMRLRGILKGLFLSDGTTGASPANFVRISVVLVRKPGSALPKYNDVFGGVDAIGQEGTPDIFQGVRLDKTGEYKLLRDIRVPLNPAAGLPQAASTVAQEFIAHVDEFVSLAGIETMYSATSTPPVYSDISMNAIVVYWRAISATPQNKVQCTMTNRLRFY
nr:MAG: capsid protein [Owegonang virus 15]